MCGHIQKAQTLGFHTEYPECTIHPVMVETVQNIDCGLEIGPWTRLWTEKLIVD